MAAYPIRAAPPPYADRYALWGSRWERIQACTLKKQGFFNGAVPESTAKIPLACNRVQFASSGHDPLLQGTHQFSQQTATGAFALEVLRMTNDAPSAPITRNPWQKQSISEGSYSNDRYLTLILCDLLTASIAAASLSKGSTFSLLLSARCVVFGRLAGRHAAGGRED